jgi:hypothetical protein
MDDQNAVPNQDRFRPHTTSNHWSSGEAAREETGPYLDRLFPRAEKRENQKNCVKRFTSQSLLWATASYCCRILYCVSTIKKHDKNHDSHTHHGARTRVTTKTGPGAGGRKHHRRCRWCARLIEWLASWALDGPNFGANTMN